MRYLFRKTMILVATVLMITVLTFLAFHVLPGDPAQMILGTQATEEALNALREQLGTNLPMHVQYMNWMRGFLHGDFGNSIRYSKPVAELLSGRIPVTLILGSMVMILTLAVSIPLGVFAARHKNTWVEQVVNFVTIIGISVPGFFLSILFMWIFGLILRLFAPGNYVSYTDSVSGFFSFMIWPALAIAIPQIAMLTKYIRTSVIDELRLDYVRTAKGKGNAPNAILYGHVLKNAIISVIPLIGMMIGDIFSGSIIVEQVFGIPGVGRLLISSVTSRDFILTQTLVVYIAVIIVLTNFVVDIVIQAIDPRIRINNW
ncbi:MAG: ABC transporter permease [Lachnospiraceae bacterium]|nr:ABC transporter permease [Lachnospiraceae bacterium]